MGNLLARHGERAGGSFDLFADALWRYHRRGKAVLYAEREGGSKSREDISWYFTGYRDFPPYEKDALKWAMGRVLDVGCGAGRHALYLQRRGLNVTGIDISPRIIELARERGVRDARVADICKKLPFLDGEFDTVVLFGNNLGICGTALRFRKMLRELARITTPGARVIGTTRLPESASRYTRRGSGEPNLEAVRLRLTDGKRHGEWFSLLLLTPDQVWQLGDKEGWMLEYLYGEELDQGYAVVLKKKIFGNQ